MAYVNSTQLYLELIQKVLDENKDILSIDFIRTGLDGLVEKNPILSKLSIDDNFKFQTELPDFPGSLEALKDFFEFLYNYMTKLLPGKDVNNRFIQIGETFIKENSTQILRTDLLEHFPSVFFKDKYTLEKLDLSALYQESEINQVIIIYESIFTVYLQEAFKTDDKTLFFSGVSDLKKSLPVLNQFLITKTGDVTIMPKDENTTEELVKDLADVFNYFVEFSSYHLGSDMATKRAQEIIWPILHLLEDLPERLGILKYLLRGALKTRLPTGISGFDLMIQGGFPRGKSILIQAPQGSEKNFFISHFIKNGLESNTNIMVILGHVSPKIFKVQLKTLDVDVSSFEKDGNLKIIDWYTGLKGDIYDVDKSEPGIINGGRDFMELWRAIENTIIGLKYSPTKCAFVNILTPGMAKYNWEKVENFTKGIIQKFRDNDITAIFMIEKESHDLELLAKIRTLFDGVIDIENETINGKTSSKIRILFMHGTEFDPKYKVMTLNGTKLKVGQT